MEIPMARRLFVFLLPFLLLACDTVPAKSEDSPYYSIPAGSMLVLHQTVTIPTNRASVYLQGGRITPFSDVDQYYPHCKFELNTLKDVPQMVEPDTFEIYKVAHGVDYAGSGLTVVVAVGLSVRGASNSGGGPSPEPYATVLFIRSAKQADVRVMTCQHWEDPTDARHLTISEVRKVLGSVFTLELAR